MRVYIIIGLGVVCQVERFTFYSAGRELTGKCTICWLLRGISAASVYCISSHPEMASDKWKGWGTYVRANETGSRVNLGTLFGSLGVIVTIELGCYLGIQDTVMVLYLVSAC